MGTKVGVKRPRRIGDGNLQSHNVDGDGICDETIELLLLFCALLRIRVSTCVSLINYGMKLGTLVKSEFHVAVTKV
mgnify:CR=1 FL=1